MRRTVEILAIGDPEEDRWRQEISSVALTSMASQSSVATKTSPAALLP